MQSTITQRTLPLSLFLLATALSGAFTVPGQNTNVSSLWLPYFITNNEALPTYGASVAVDPQGGIHAAYAVYSASEQGGEPAIYAYCPANPAERSNWTFVRLGENVQDVRLALDSAGRPRLMLFGAQPDPETSHRKRYQYAECNSGWTNAAQWTLSTIVTPLEATATREYDNNRYFAISPQGRVAFVYTDTANNNHPGTFYVSCAGDCTNPANWTETALAMDFYFDKPSLVFSRDGQPHLAFGVFYGDDLYLAYARGSGDGTDPNGWSVVLLASLHGSAMYSLQVTPEGRPRLALSSGSSADAPFTAHQLYYLWCNNGSDLDAGNWQFNNGGLYFVAGGVDLVLDRQGHPRISCAPQAGLGYVWCDDDGTSAISAWHNRIVESDASLAANVEVLPIYRCTQSSWNTGQRSRLVLDAAGTAYFAYDAEHTWSGAYVDRPWENCQFKDVTMTRFAFLPALPFLSLKRSGNQLEIHFGGGTLEWAPDLTGPWTATSVTNSPFLLTPTEPTKFFRVQP